MTDIQAAMGHSADMTTTRPRQRAGVTTKVTVLAGPPLGEVRPVDCVTLHPDDPLACAVDRAVAQPPDPLVEAARTITGVHVIDLTDYFCDEHLCYAVVGDVAVYYDENHVNREYARSLKPMLAAELGYR